MTGRLELGVVGCMHPGCSEYTTVNWRQKYMYTIEESIDNRSVAVDFCQHVFLADIGHNCTL